MPGTIHGKTTGEADVGSVSARRKVQDRGPYMIQELREDTPTHTGLKLEF